MAARDEFTKKWITENSVEIIKRYTDGELTIRALHYQLVGIGMTNTDRHYKRVVKAMIDARWDGLVRFETFSDHDRQVLGDTSIDEPTDHSGGLDREESTAGSSKYGLRKQPSGTSTVQRISIAHIPQRSKATI